MTDRTMHAEPDSLDQLSRKSSSDECHARVERHAEDSSSRRLTSSAIARGRLLLSLLARQAAAARAEAQCAELRLLLGEARDGDSQRLQRWLAAHAAEYPQALGEGSSDRDDSVFHVASSSPSPLMNAADSSSAETGSSRSDGSQRPNRSESRSATAPSQSEVGSSASALQPQPLESWQPLLGPALARLHEQAQRLRSDRSPVQQPRDEPLQSRLPPPRRQWFFSPTGGAAASLSAHCLLIFLLAWITLRVPSPPASLHLEAASVEWQADAMELSQPMELSQLDASEESRPADAPWDSSDVLADASRDIDAALRALPAPASGLLPSGNMLAASSSVSRLMQSNTTFYGAAAAGNCFCYLIDGSGSMRDGPWEAAKLELLKSLATLKEKQRFYIIFFNRELSAIPLPGEQTAAPAALYATPDNLAHTRRWLDTLRIDRGAPPNDALELAISKEPDAIYLLTDGATTVDVPMFLRQSNRISDSIFGEQVRVPIHTIAFYSLEGQTMLKQIASENDGQFVYVPNPRRK